MICCEQLLAMQQLLPPLPLPLIPPPNPSLQPSPAKMLLSTLAAFGCITSQAHKLSTLLEGLLLDGHIRRTHDTVGRTRRGDNKMKWATNQHAFAEQ